MKYYFGSELKMRFFIQTYSSCHPYELFNKLQFFAVIDLPFAIKTPFDVSILNTFSLIAGKRIEWGGYGGATEVLGTGNNSGKCRV